MDIINKLCVSFLLLILPFSVLSSDLSEGVKIDKKSDAIKVDLLSKSTTSWDGSTLPAYGRGQPEISIIKVTIAPNTTLPFHKHPLINAGYLLKGELTVVSETNEVLKMKPGDTLIELVGKWHYGKNEGKESVEILVFYAGVEGDELSIKRH
ncbi:cupin domain-containing protein [Shewanella donghaensis]|uniref:cupin domain-containing protein n=1 Tax=Shewanella donghaensis TaxID=238836 RepID=UPI001182DACE|nr:cupin domain-containing protein [Shewanella donghaensis]